MTTGRDILRGALKARNRTPAFLANLREEIGDLSISAIESWIAGDDKALTRTQLNGIVSSIWGAMVELGDDDVLRSANKSAPTALAAAYPTTSAINASDAIVGRTRPDLSSPLFTPKDGPPGPSRPSLLRRIGWG